MDSSREAGGSRNGENSSFLIPPDGLRRGRIEFFPRPKTPLPRWSLANVRRGGGASKSSNPCREPPPRVPRQRRRQPHHLLERRRHRPALAFVGQANQLHRFHQIAGQIPIA
jgi:hypothetical protein